MKPVVQTRVGRPAGNCTEASIASVFEVDLDDVPQLWDPTDTTDPDQRPRHRLDEHMRWVRARGIVQVEIRFAPRTVTHWPELQRDDPVWREAGRLLQSWHFLFGNNPDGVSHQVVAHGGVMVWDTNPSRRGLVDLRGAIALIHESCLYELTGHRPADIPPEKVLAWVFDDLEVGP